MTKFEKDFPSLKGKGFIDAETDLIEYFEEDIQKHCLDKQKVKEVIDKWLLFSDRKRLEDEFIEWAKKNNATEIPMNVIAWFHSKRQSELKIELGLE